MQSIEVNTLTPVLVVVGIIQHPISKKLLITQRTNDQHLAGFWEFPGGKVEKNEVLFHALQRELQEEVGINIQSAHPLKKITHHYSDQSVCLSFWVVSNFSGDAFAKEGQELEWVDLTELTKYKFPEANKPIINSLSLPTYWMITPDCDINKIDEFIDSIIQSVTQFHLKQILFRSKNLNDMDYFLVYEKLKYIIDKYDCQIILNRNELKENISASWHLTSTQLYQHINRPIGQGNLSASCHTIEDIKQAEKIGVDFILLSAVCQTHSHPDSNILGWLQFNYLAEQTALPIYALGGVKREDLTVARNHGAIGVAGISAFIVRT